MRPRLMSNAEVWLRRRLGFKGRRFSFHCPVCAERAYDEWRVSGESKGVPMLAVPMLPNTIGCPYCRNEWGCAVDQSRKPEIARCNRCTGALAPAAVDHEAKLYWRVAQQHSQGTVLERRSYAVDLHVRCTACTYKGSIVVRPVRSPASTSRE